MPVRIEPYDDERGTLRSLFELAEDSARELDGYLSAGRVIVARDGDALVGHLQLTETGGFGGRAQEHGGAARAPGAGIGRALVAAAVAIAAGDGRWTMVVATAAADIGNLRFYQRQGFRLRSIERDAFTAAAGCHDEVIDGIPLRDRVWLDRAL